MPPVFDQAICIRHWDWSETSQTLTLLSRQHGLLRLLAKGSRRPNAPFSGGVELLTRGEAGIILKPSADLGLLTEWDLSETFPHLRRRLSAYVAACYGADLVQHLVLDRDPHPDLYDALLCLLRGVADDTRAPAQLLLFQHRAIASAGYAPELTVCAATSQPLPKAATYHYSPALGGLVRAAQPDAQTWPVRAATVELLRAVAAMRIDDGPDALSDPAILDAGKATIARANRLLASIIRMTLGREPPTLRTVFPDLAAGH